MTKMEFAKKAINKSVNIISKILQLKTKSTFFVALNKKTILRWSNSKETKNNFGDALNPWLFNSIFGVLPVSSNTVFNLLRRDVFFFVGSILDGFDEKTGIVIGSGFKSFDSYTKKPPKKLIAVRGPLTREVFRNHNIECPEVYCDPALMLPIIKPSKGKIRWDVGIIPHYVDKLILSGKILNDHGCSYKIIDIESPISQVIEEITSSKYIFSSSLHGLIVAHAYGIPATWLVLSDKIGGGEFKFLDYAFSCKEATFERYIVDDIIDFEHGIQIAKCFSVKNNIESLCNVLINNFSVSKDFIEMYRNWKI
jgi:pyruvyltransferase